MIHLAILHFEFSAVFHFILTIWRNAWLSKRFKETCILGGGYWKVQFYLLGGFTYHQNHVSWGEGVGGYWIVQFHLLGGFTYHQKHVSWGEGIG